MTNLTKAEREELRRLCEAFQTADDACNQAWAEDRMPPVAKLVEARTELDEYSIDLLPKLLNALDEADKRIAELEGQLGTKQDKPQRRPFIAGGGQVP